MVTLKRSALLFVGAVLLYALVVVAFVHAQEGGDVAPVPPCECRVSSS